MTRSEGPPGDAAFCAQVTHALARIPGVQAVMLGGSRAANARRRDPTHWTLAEQRTAVAFAGDV